MIIYIYILCKCNTDIFLYMRPAEKYCSRMLSLLFVLTAHLWEGRAQHPHTLISQARNTMHLAWADRSEGPPERGIHRAQHLPMEVRRVGVGPAGGRSSLFLALFTYFRLS